MFTKGKHVFYTYILLKQTIWSIWVFFFNLHLGIFVANQSNKTAKKLYIIVFIFKGISPLWWRLPILLWSLIVLFWSMAFFWGPTEKYFLYMTHWGLVFIVVESIFGIVVTVRKPCGRQAGKTSILVKMNNGKLWHIVDCREERDVHWNQLTSNL